METIEIIGMIAATLTTSAFVPQVYKTYMERSAKDISLTMYLVFLTGTLLWLSYGLHHDSLPIVLANAVTALLIILMIWMKLRFR